MKHSCKRVPGSLVFLNKFQERLPMEHWQNGNRTEWIENGYGTDMEQVRNGYRTGTGTRVERQQNAFCQAFPVRFLLIGTVFFQENLIAQNPLALLENPLALGYWSGLSLHTLGSLSKSLWLVLLQLPWLKRYGKDVSVLC